jgi:hypothetical protein
MSKDIYKNLVKEFVVHYFSKKPGIDVFIDDITSYKIPSKENNTIFIVNLSTGETLDEEEKYKLKEDFEFTFESSKFQLRRRIPFTSSKNDKVFLNFLD